MLWGRVNDVGVDTATGSTAIGSTARHGDGHRTATGTERLRARGSHGHWAAAGTGRTRVRDGHGTGIARARHGYGHGHDHGGIRTILQRRLGMRPKTGFRKNGTTAPSAFL